MFWGVAPVYFVWVSFAYPLEVLAQRILWSVPLLALFVSVGRQWTSLGDLPRSSYLRLMLGSLLLSVNWLTFIYGVMTERIAETSLGYFINPIVTIALAALVLGERISPLQWVAVTLAGLGIAFELVSLGELPWIAVTLALSFGFYGLVRKQLSVPAALGLGIETALLAPFAAAFLMLGVGLGYPDIGERSLAELGMLAVGGLVTTLPLLWFGAAASRLPLSVIGVFQYLAPSLSLLLAVFVFRETVTTERWINFGFVWLAILVFSFAGAVEARRSRA